MKKSALAVAVLAPVMIDAAAMAQAVQWRVQDGGNGHWYEVAQLAVGTPWTTARDLAVSLGGHLVTLTTVEETRFVRTVVGSSGPWFQGGHGPWMGASRYSIDSAWQWVTGEPWRFAAWCLNQPSNTYCPNFELCLCAKVDDYCDNEHWWGDINESGNCPPYVSGLTGMVVEWEADCNNDGVVDFGQIRLGLLTDQNRNNIPDVCECAKHPELIACCSGDILRDGRVDGADLAAVLSHWGTVTSDTVSRACDLNQDGTVDGTDLGLLLAHWGPCGG